jgi:hypothetical protein
MFSRILHFLWVTVTGEIYREEALGPVVRPSIRIGYEASWVSNIRLRTETKEEFVRLAGLVALRQTPQVLN